MAALLYPPLLTTYDAFPQHRVWEAVIQLYEVWAYWFPVRPILIPDTKKL
jgi:hypothetical protein